MACKRPRCCETTYARTGPSRSSSSAAAATKTHPPGREGSVAQRRQFSKSARTRGRPRGCLNAGRMTLSTKRSEATRSISSCSSSFESKCAKRPLLERPSLPASAPRLSPSRPSRAASRKAVSRMRSRVSVPFATGDIVRPVVRKRKPKISRTFRGPSPRPRRAPGSVPLYPVPRIARPW